MVDRRRRRVVASLVASDRGALGMDEGGFAVDALLQRHVHASQQRRLCSQLVHLPTQLRDLPFRGRHLVLVHCTGAVATAAAMGSELGVAVVLVVAPVGDADDSSPHEASVTYTPAFDGGACTCTLPSPAAGATTAADAMPGHEHGHGQRVVLVGTRATTGRRRCRHRWCWDRRAGGAITDRS